MKTSRRPRPPSAVYTLQSLAAATGVPARTIRYYIASGVLAGPLKRGRGAAYTAEHVARLRAIQRRQQQGESLAEIRAAASGPAPAPPGAVWRHYHLADDVAVLLREGMPPWRAHVVLRHMDALARALHTPPSDSLTIHSHTRKESK